ncbi:MAG: TetR/AcrR family transcriptional regulator [Chloroflexota bacterium]|nr:TetR/AcrR family transcriptional regulator [Chloroflexota bacterium]
MRLTKSRRPYRLQARAAAMDRTRERITRAAIELHGSVGPAATTMSAVADRAGVTRATLYRHFANESALFAACSADWLAANPRPNLAGWAAVADPALRLRTALEELYAYYRSTERMRANLLRDIDVLPATIRSGIAAFPTAAVDVLATDWLESSGARLRRAVIGHAVGFATWQSLAGQGLTDPEAAGLMVRLVTSVE